MCVKKGGASAQAYTTVVFASIGVVRTGANGCCAAIHVAARICRMSPARAG